MLLFHHVKMNYGLWHHISEDNFRSINWLPTSKKVNQCISTITIKSFDNACSLHLKEVLEFAPHCRIDTTNTFSKLKIPFCNTNMGQKAIAFVVPSL